MTTKEQIQALLDTKPMTAAIVTRIKELLADPSEATAKAKQAFHDQREIANLKATVKALKDKITPASDTKGTSTDQLLDSLFTLQHKRANEINRSGLSVKLGTSDKSFPALQADEKTLYLPAGTPTAIGTHVNADNELLGIITSTTAQAGRLKCEIWKPRQTTAVHEKTATATGWNLRKSSGSIPCQLCDDTVTTFAKSFPVGTILQCSDGFYEVVSSATEGQLVRHALKPYTELAKAAPAPQKGVDTRTGMSGYSMYHNRVID